MWQLAMCLCHSTWLILSISWTMSVSLIFWSQPHCCWIALYQPLCTQKHWCSERKTRWHWLRAFSAAIFQLFQFCLNCSQLNTEQMLQPHQVLMRLFLNTTEWMMSTMKNYKEQMYSRLTWKQPISASSETQQMIIILSVHFNETELAQILY